MYIQVNKNDTVQLQFFLYFFLISYLRYFKLMCVIHVICQHLNICFGNNQEWEDIETEIQLNN